MLSTEFSTSWKWWNEKSHSRSIHVNSGSVLRFGPTPKYNARSLEVRKCWFCFYIKNPGFCQSSLHGKWCKKLFVFILMSRTKKEYRKNEGKKDNPFVLWCSIRVKALKNEIKGYLVFETKKIYIANGLIKKGMNM